tara:strand:- start:27567 stop:27914 length:348 start_codon:yes stop_codon:yes gene_type:complete
MIMPVLDPLKAALTDHLQTLIKQCSLGSGSTDASSRDGGAGNTKMSRSATVQKIDNRTISVSALFDTQVTSEQSITEVVLHGTNPLDTPSFRATFMPIQKNSTNEVRVDILMEVR